MLRKFLLAAAVLAALAVSLQNPNNIVEEVSRATSEMEKEAVSWLAEHLFGLDPKLAWGNVVSGGTVANMTALLVARDYAYDKLSRPRPARVGARGIAAANPGIVLASAGSHYSLEKALWFLGIGAENLIRVPVCFDESTRLQEKKEKRFLRGIQDQAWKEQVHAALEEDRIL